MSGDGVIGIYSPLGEDQGLRELHLLISPKKAEQRTVKAVLCLNIYVSSSPAGLLIHRASTRLTQAMKRGLLQMGSKKGVRSLQRPPVSASANCCG